MLRPALLPLLLAIGLTACDGEGSVRITTTTKTDDHAENGVLKVIDTLQCPDTIGSLTRKGLAAAGRDNCIYGGPRGAEVVLHLVSLKDATAESVLQQFEQRLKNELPQTAVRLGAGQPMAVAANAQGDAASVSAPGVQVNANGDDASVRLPGISIDAKGDSASVRIGGFHINTTESGQSQPAVKADIEAGDEGDSVRIRASNNVSEVRTIEGGDATRMTYILSDDQPSDAGWRLVGFEARGPQGGPVVVATVRSKERKNDRVFDDARDLVTLNVGK